MCSYLYLESKKKIINLLDFECLIFYMMVIVISIVKLMLGDV